MIKTLMKRALALSVAMTVSSLALFAVCAPATAEPGLWLAQGPQAKIFLFGTIHVLPQGQVWESPAIADALGASQELWLEVPDPNNTQEAQRVMNEIGFDPQHPLSTKLSPQGLAQLDAVAKAVGMPNGEQALEGMRPWLASVAIEGALLVNAGYDPDSGVEPVLLHDALAARKTVHGFETLEQQLHFFGDMKPALELDMLQNTLQDFDHGKDQIDALVAAWLDGDDAAITRMTVDEVKVPFPALYRTILVDRNEAWADAIASMLKGSGVRFIAVGVAHLSGPDSLQTALARRGVHVARVTEP
jgi:uncharacterized protein YbaP (TraB family)